MHQLVECTEHRRCGGRVLIDTPPSHMLHTEFYSHTTWTHPSYSLKIRRQIFSGASSLTSASTSCDTRWNIQLRPRVTSCWFKLTSSRRLAPSTEQSAVAMCRRDTTFTKKHNHRINTHTHKTKFFPFYISSSPEILFSHDATCLPK